MEKIEDKLYDVVPDAINRFRISYVKEEENRVLAEMQKPEIVVDEEKLTNLMLRYNELKKMEVALDKAKNKRWDE